MQQVYLILAFVLLKNTAVCCLYDERTTKCNTDQDRKSKNKKQKKQERASVMRNMLTCNYAAV